MSKIDQIRQGLKRMVKPESYQVFMAKVLSVDTSNGSCTVLIEEINLELFNVRIKSIIKDDTNGIMIVPSIDSYVLVGLINDNISSLYVVSYSAIDSVTYNDGSYGGFVRADILKQELSKTNEVVQALVDAVTNWTVIASDGGAAFKAYFATQIAGKAVGSFDDIESEYLTHGE